MLLLIDNAPVKKTYKKTLFGQMLKFLIFAGTAAFVNIGARFLLSWMKVEFYIAVTTAYFMGMIVNFLLNKNYNFPKGGRHYVQEMRSFTIIALFGLLLTNVFSGFFVYTFGYFFKHRLLETTAHVSAVGIVSIYSFFAHKYFTYRHGLRNGIKKILGNLFQQ